MRSFIIIICVILFWEQSACGQWTNVSSGLAGSNSIVYLATVPGQDKVIACPSQQNLNATTDGGTTFSSMGSISHNDGLSVDFTDPTRNTVLVSGHEAKQKLNKTTDNGATWTNTGLNLPASTHFSVYPLILDTDIYIVGCSGWGDLGSAVSGDLTEYTYNAVRQEIFIGTGAGVFKMGDEVETPVVERFGLSRAPVSVRNIYRISDGIFTVPDLAGPATISFYSLEGKLVSWMTVRSNETVNFNAASSQVFLAHLDLD